MYNTYIIYEIYYIKTLNILKILLYFIFTLYIFNICNLLFNGLGAVKDIQWRNDNTHVLTASFDKTIKLFDVEVGKVVQVKFFFF